ncbi:MAG: hypothetical protein A3B70_02730 [Deltaproteobacteria bacterium RIFCSPHIGHO2_02_FULL_40_11]|nr:MAG: hypothetical protein A3B70_02730 [Deltaproteobacteria bacterium RIFCSPHIGHO2_02_FULL_40_11]
MVIVFATVLVFKGDFRPEKQEPALTQEDSRQEQIAQKKKHKIEWETSKIPQRQPAATPTDIAKAEAPKEPEIIDNRGLIETEVQIVKDELGREIIADDIIVSVDMGTGKTQLNALEKNYPIQLEYYDPGLGVAKFKILSGASLSRTEIQTLMQKENSFVSSAQSNALMETFDFLDEGHAVTSEGEKVLFAGASIQNPQFVDLLSPEISTKFLWYLANGNTQRSPSNYSMYYLPTFLGLPRVTMTQNMDLFGGLYAMQTYFFTDQTHAFLWDNQVSCGEGLIAVVDSGFDPYHPDLKDNYMIGKTLAGQNITHNINCNVSNSPSSFLSSDQAACYDPGEHDALLQDLAAQTDRKRTEGTMSHGHQVASIIAAKHNNFNNGGPSAGLCPRGKIIPIVMGRLQRDGNNVRYVFTDVDGAYGIKAAVDAGAKVINTSWGNKTVENWRDLRCDGKAYPAHCALVRAIKYAAARGTLIVTAAGNSYDDLDKVQYAPPSLSHYPDPENEGQYIGFDNVISVAAYGPDGKLWVKRDSVGNRDVEFSKSNHYGSNYGRHTVDIAAPGEFIYVPSFSSEFIYSHMNYTLPTPSYVPFLVSQEGTWAVGTSVAAPMVTAIAGMMYRELPSYSDTPSLPYTHNMAKAIKDKFLTAYGLICDARYQMRGSCLNAAAALFAMKEKTKTIEIAMLDKSFLDTFSGLEDAQSGPDQTGSSDDSGSTGLSSESSGGSAGGGGGGCGFIDPSSGNGPQGGFPIFFYLIPLLLFIRRRKWAMQQSHIRRRQ